MQQFSDCKLVISNNIFEFYKYEYEVEIGEKKEKENKPRYKSNNLRNRIISYRLSKRTVRRLINANIQKWTDHCGNIVSEKFVTLTFNTQIEVVKEANYQFKKFIQRLNYYYLGEKKNYFKYVTVIEFMKNNRIHYHSLFFNIPYTPNKTLNKLWSNGFVKINKLKNEYNIGSYVTKYMTKREDKRLCGEKSYFTSRGLLKPIITFNKNEVSAIFKIMPKELQPYIKKFQTDFTGKSIYYNFDLKEYPNLKNTICELLTSEDQKPIYELP